MTAYEMRISDWSSDVCSSDLVAGGRGGEAGDDVHIICNPFALSRGLSLSKTRIEASFDTPFRLRSMATQDERPFSWLERAEGVGDRIAPVAAEIAHAQLHAGGQIGRAHV